MAVVAITAGSFAKAQDFSVMQNTLTVYNNNTPAGNAKFEAMAGANGALGGDASSMLTNPAGLGVAISSSFNATLGFNNTTNTTTLGSASMNWDHSSTDLSNVQGTLALGTAPNSRWKFVNVGINYSSKSLDNIVQTPALAAIGGTGLLTDGVSNISATMPFQGHIYDRSGRQSALNIGVAGNYDNQIYLGASLGFHSTTLDQFDQARFSMPNSGVVNVFDNQGTPYAETGQGFDANIGIIGKVTPDVRAGLSIQTPIFWTIDRAWSYYSSDGTIADGTYSETRKLRTPAKVTGSLAYVGGKNLALNLDYTMGFTKDKFTETSGGESLLNQEFANHANNYSQVRVGGEYRYQRLRIRAGYAFTNAPFKNDSFEHYTGNGSVANGNVEDLLSGRTNSVGVGLGYEFNRFSLDLTYKNISQSYANPFFSYNQVDNSGGNGGYYPASTATGIAGVSFASEVSPSSTGISTVKNNLNNVYLTLGWKF